MLGACVHGAAFEGSPIQLCAQVRFAGAIGSLKWKGVEFINHRDHGRELQTAVSYDNLGEAENPTEAGARSDHGYPISSSLLLRLKVVGTSLITTARMAFWKPYKGKNLSKTLLSKNVNVGWQGFPNVIKYEVSLQVVETHTRVAFEALTGYMPASFNQFYTYHAKHLAPLPSPKGNLALAGQRQPIIVVDPIRGVAMGIRSPEPTLYGNGVLTRHSVTKWNIFFEETPAQPPVTYSHEIFLAIGTLPDVERAMDALEAALPVR